MRFASVIPADELASRRDARPMTKMLASRKTPEPALELSVQTIQRFWLCQRPAELKARSSSRIRAGLILGTAIATVRPCIEKRLHLKLHSR
jgi:hypothetical protein